LLINEYFSQFRYALNRFPFCNLIQIEEDIRSETEGFIKGQIVFSNSSALSFREYCTIIENTVKRLSYSFHYHRDNELIFRYDNAPHFPNLSTFPDHKHLSENEVQQSSPPTIEKILLEIETYLTKKI